MSLLSRRAGLAAPAVAAFAIAVGACGSSNNPGHATGQKPPQSAQQQSMSGPAAQPAFCGVVKTLDTDFGHFVDSDGQNPPKSALEADGQNLAEQAQQAGPPYSDEVHQFASLQDSGDTKGSIGMLDKIESQCHLPPSKD